MANNDGSAYTRPGHAAAAIEELALRLGQRSGGDRRLAKRARRTLGSSPCVLILVALRPPIRMVCRSDPEFLYQKTGQTLPTCAEAQGEWVVEFLDYLRENDITRIEATREAEERWTAAVDEIVAGALFGQAKSWYMGANIPGKKAQMLMYPRRPAELPQRGQ